MTLAVRLTYNTVAVFRKTLTILSLLGLLLSVGLWGASYYGIEYQMTVEKRRDMHMEWFTLWNGSLTYWGTSSVMFGLTPLPDISLEEMRAHEWHFKDDVLIRGLARSAWQLPHFMKDLVIIPLGTASVAFAMPIGATWVICFRRRRKREMLGLCLKCGYDLRGSKERCPECGSEFESTGV